MERIASNFSATSTSTATSPFAQQTLTQNDPSEPVNAVTATGALIEFPPFPGTHAVATNSVNIGTSPSGQPVADITGELMTDIEVVDPNGVGMNASGGSAGNGSVTVQVTSPNAPPNSPWNADLSIAVDWGMGGNPNGFTGFLVQIFRGNPNEPGNGPQVSAMAAPLESGMVTVTDENGTRVEFVDPQMGGLTLTRTLTNVRVDETFTIRVGSLTDGAFNSTTTFGRAVGIEAKVLMPPQQ